MRILFVNKFAFNRGGQERVVFDEMAWLRERGHTTELFSTAHPDNLEWRYADQFAKYREIGAHGTPSAAAAIAMFWNTEAERALASVIEDFQPDVVHFHGIHRHLSPSVTRAARRSGAITVMTLHDYWPVCPANVLLRDDGCVCEPVACGASFASAVRYRCVQGSKLKSSLAAVELAWQRSSRAYQRSLDVLISPSRFLRDLVTSRGFSVSRFEVVPNAVQQPSCPAEGIDEPAFLFAGRLSNEKGLAVLIPAAEKAGVRLAIAGDGPLRDHIASLPFVDYLGMLDEPALARARARATATVVPSTWYENAPMSILESMASGKAVIATAIGGIPELVRDGKEGLLVTPSDVEELAIALRRLNDDAELAKTLGTAGLQRAVNRYSPEQHCDRLLAAYSGACQA